MFAIDVWSIAGAAMPFVGAIAALAVVLPAIYALVWRIERGSYRSPCAHELEPPTGNRYTKEGLRYACWDCAVEIRRVNDKWPPWCSEHPKNTCAWPRCVPLHGPRAIVRHWKDLALRGWWNLLDAPY